MSACIHRSSFCGCTFRRIDLASFFADTFSRSICPSSSPKSNNTRSASHQRVTERQAVLRLVSQATESISLSNYRSFGDLPYLHNTGTSCFMDVARLQSRIPYPFSSHYVPSITSFILVPSVSFLRILDSKSVSCFPWLSSLELEPVLSRIGLQLAVAVEKGGVLFFDLSFFSLVTCFFFGGRVGWRPSL